MARPFHSYPTAQLTDWSLAVKYKQLRSIPITNAKESHILRYCRPPDSGWQHHFPFHIFLPIWPETELCIISRHRAFSNTCIVWVSYRGKRCSSRIIQNIDSWTDLIKVWIWTRAARVHYRDAVRLQECRIHTASCKEFLDVIRHDSHSAIRSLRDPIIHALSRDRWEGNGLPGVKDRLVISGVQVVSNPGEILILVFIDDVIVLFVHMSVDGDK